MSLRREAARTVFCFFFGGDKLAMPSLAADRATAFSGAAACRDRGGSAGGGEAAAVASLRPNGSRAIGALSTAFRIRTIRALGAMADAGTTAGADVSLDLWAGASADA